MNFEDKYFILFERQTLSPFTQADNFICLYKMIQDINCVHKNCSQETSVKTKCNPYHRGHL